MSAGNRDVVSRGLIRLCGRASRGGAASGPAPPFCCWVAALKTSRPGCGTRTPPCAASTPPGPADPPTTTSSRPSAACPKRSGSWTIRLAALALHAPRQTGKTTTVRALAARLTEAGRYAALHFSCEVGRVFPEDVGAAEQAVWSSIEEAARLDLPEPLRPPPTTSAATGEFLKVQLTRWARAALAPSCWSSTRSMPSKATASNRS